MLRTWVRLAVPLLLVALASVADVGAVGAEPTAYLDTTNPKPGDSVLVLGKGWPIGSGVKIEVCGNNRLNGSADCDQPSSIQFAVWSHGELHAPITIPTPPRPCPCVVHIADVTREHAATIPIDIQGVPSAPLVQESTALNADTALKVVASSVASHSSLSSFFGGPASRTLRLTVRNEGTTAVANPSMAIRWGRSDHANNFVPAPVLEPFAPGEERIVEVPFELDPFSVGEYEVSGSVTATGSGSNYNAAKTSNQPWGLLIVALLLVQLFVVKVRNMLRRRTAKSQAEQDEEARLIRDEYDLVGPAG